jgi:hypothetical protein
MGRAAEPGGTALDPGRTATGSPTAGTEAGATSFLNGVAKAFLVRRPVPVPEGVPPPEPGVAARGVVPSEMPIRRSGVDAPPAFSPPASDVACRTE